MDKKSTVNPPPLKCLTNSQKSKARNVISPELNDLISALQDLPNQAILEYTPLVENVIKNAILNKMEIERLLDGMLDFCYDDGMLNLFKKLCRYYFAINPYATAEYVYAYRDMWDNEECAAKENRTGCKIEKRQTSRRRKD